MIRACRWRRFSGIDRTISQFGLRRAKGRPFHSKSPGIWVGEHTPDRALYGSRRMASAFSGSIRTATGPCEVQLNYDGGWELRLGHYLSFAAMLTLAVGSLGGMWRGLVRRPSKHLA
jgi:hypothetical protein